MSSPPPLFNTSTLAWGMGGIISFIGLRLYKSFSSGDLKGLDNDRDQERSWRDELNTLERENASLRRSLADTQASIHAKDTQISNLQSNTAKAVNASKARVLEVERQLGEVQAELKRVAGERSALEGLLETRSKELQMAQAYLSRTDTFSGADIKKMVVALNAEILQTAALISDAFEFQRSAPAVDEQGIKLAREELDIYLGGRMLELLATSNHHEDTFLIQLACQASMCAWAKSMISSWYFHGPEAEENLNSIYEHLRDSEEPSVSGKWRALTREYAQQLVQPLNMMPFFSYGFANIFLLAGLTMPSDRVQTIISERFHDQIDTISEKIVTLNRAMGKGVLSSELLVLTVDPNVPLDKTIMEATSQDGQDTEPVLCTTDLGLVLHEKVGAEWRHSVLLKPRVLLQSELEAEEAV